MSDDLSGFSMMDLFRMEADERLSVLSQGLVALEGTGATAATDRALDARGHSLKGRGAGGGLCTRGAVAHAMEDCLVAAQKGQIALQAGHVDTLLGGVDLLQTDLAGLGGGAGGLASGAWRGGRVARGDLAAIQAGASTWVAPSPGLHNRPGSAGRRPAPPSPCRRRPLLRRAPCPSPPDDLSGFSMMDLFRMEAEERLAALL